MVSQPERPINGPCPPMYDGMPLAQTAAHAGVAIEAAGQVFVVSAGVGQIIRIQ